MVMIGQRYPYCHTDRAVGVTQLHRGKFIAAQTRLEHGVALYDPVQHSVGAFYGQQDAGIGCMAFSGYVLCYIGFLDQANTRVTDALAIAQQLTHPFSEAFCLQMTSLVHYSRDEFSCMQTCAEAAIKIATEQGFAYWLASGTMLRGRALIAQGQEKIGLSQLQQGLEACRASGARSYQTRFLALLAEAYQHNQQPSKGLDTITEALRFVEAVGERFYEAELYRLEGELLLAQGHSAAEAAAESCYLQALDIARQQQAKSLELRAATSLARLWRDQGKRQQAHDLIAPVYDWFSEGFDTADLKDAKALLDELVKLAETKCRQTQNRQVTNGTSKR